MVARTYHFQVKHRVANAIRSPDAEHAIALEVTGQSGLVNLKGGRF